MRRRVALLNQRFDNSCKIESTMDSTSAVCSVPGGSATLQGAGAGSAIVPQHIEACYNGEDGDATCRNVVFEPGTDAVAAADEMFKNF